MSPVVPVAPGDFYFVEWLDMLRCLAGGAGVGQLQHPKGVDA